MLHRRQNTGYQDGKWDIAGSGRVDKGETPQHAVARECEEELGIGVKIEDLSFAHLSFHQSSDRTYYDIYFIVHRYEGSPSIMEPDKCSALEWFDIDKLPKGIIECRRQVINSYRNSHYYSETFDYTEWQRELYKDIPLEEFLNDATAFRRRHDKAE